VIFTQEQVRKGIGKSNATLKNFAHFVTSLPWPYLHSRFDGLLLPAYQATALFPLPDTLRPRSLNDPAVLFGTPLLETLFGPSAFFLTLREILFSVNPSAECGL